MSKALMCNPQPGEPLFGLVKHVDQQKIDAFGAVSGGVGAIHLSPEFGRTTPFKTTLVQGYLLLGYITEMLKNNFGRRFVSGGELEVKLVGPAREGDSLVIGGQVEDYAVLDGKREKGIRVSVFIRNQQEELVAVGTAFL